LRWQASSRNNRRKSILGQIALLGALLGVIVFGGVGCSEPTPVQGTCGGGYSGSGGDQNWHHYFLVLKGSDTRNRPAHASVQNASTLVHYMPVCEKKCENSKAMIETRKRELADCAGLPGIDSARRQELLQKIDHLNTLYAPLLRRCNEISVENLYLPEDDEAAQTEITNAGLADTQCQCDPANLDDFTRGGCAPLNAAPEAHLNQAETYQSSADRGAGGSIINTPENNAAAARNTQAGSGSGVGNAGLLSGNVNAATAGGRPTSSLNFNKPNPLSSNSPSGGDPNKVPARTFSTGGSSPTGAGSSTSSAGGPSSRSAPSNNAKSTDTPSLGGPVVAQDPYGGTTQSAATGGGYSSGGITRSATGGGQKEDSGFTFGSSGGSGPGGAGGTPGSQSFNGTSGAGGNSNFAQGVQDAEDYFTRIPLEASLFEIVEKRYRKFDSLWSAEDTKTSTTPAQP
jgi:hypothetical protein